MPTSKPNICPAHGLSKELLCLAVACASSRFAWSEDIEFKGCRHMCTFVITGLQEKAMEVCEILLHPKAYKQHGQIILDAISDPTSSPAAFLSDSDFNSMAELLLSAHDSTHKMGMAAIKKFQKFFQPGIMLEFVTSFAGMSDLQLYLISAISLAKSCWHCLGGTIANVAHDLQL